MAYAALGQVSAGSTNNNSITTGTLDTTGADFLVAVVADYGASARSVPTDSKGNSWTGLTSRAHTNDVRVTIWYTRPTSVGTGHTFTATGTTTYPSIMASAWSGSMASPFDVENGAVAGAATTTLATGSVTPSLANELVIAALAANAGASAPTIGGGFTVYASVNASGAHEAGGLAYLIQTTAAAANPTWTNSASSSLAAAIATFKLTDAVAQSQRYQPLDGRPTVGIRPRAFAPGLAR